MVTALEIVKGLWKMQREAALVKFLQDLTKTEVLAFDTDIAILAGRIHADMERTGQTIGISDCMIAATAVHHGLTLVTGNTRHYERIAALGYALPLENWRD